MQTLLLVLDLCGTFVFAVSGAAAANKRDLDLFGVLVVSFVAGNFGGIVRDVLIGAVPPAAISDWRYLAVSIAAVVLTFLWDSLVGELWSFVLISDAAGLALFAVGGTQKALSFSLNPLMAALLGRRSGMARDLLLAQVPTVLKADFYATAALLGAVVVVLGQSTQLPPWQVAIVAAVIAFGVALSPSTKAGVCHAQALTSWLTVQNRNRISRPPRVPNAR
jgi:uncharacterized membrane protein YeiH